MRTGHRHRRTPLRRSLAATVGVLVAFPTVVTACSASGSGDPPKAPTYALALPGSGAIGVGWGVPKHQDESTSYTATAEPGGKSCTARGAHASRCTISGLADGTTYTVRVRATGPGGSSKALATTPTTAGVPWPPDQVTPTAGDTAVSLTWYPPYADAANITGYVATASPGGATCRTALRSCTVTGLTNGTRYRFTVVAINPFGQGLRTDPTMPVTPGTTAGGTTGITYLGPLDAQAENTSTTILQRDAGLSVSLPSGRALWIFVDTSAFSSAADPSGQFVGGSTAAKGVFKPGGKRGLTDVKPARSDSGAQSNQFLPTPTNTFMPDGSGRSCTPANGALYAARWPTGATLLTDTSLVLITYTDVCVLSPDRFQVEGWGFVEYQWRGGRIRLGPVDVFPPKASGAALPETQAFQSPVVSGGKVTLYVSTCEQLFVGCNRGSVLAATVIDNPFALVNPASYATVPVAAPSDGPWTPVNISVAAYGTSGTGTSGTASSGTGTQYRIVEQTSIAGTFKLLGAPTPTGPWSPLTSGTLPGCNLTPQGFCYAFVGHPGLSTKLSVLMTYFKPDSEQNTKIGHVVVASVALPVAPKPVVIPKY